MSVYPMSLSMSCFMMTEWLHPPAGSKAWGDGKSKSVVAFAIGGVLYLTAWAVVFHGYLSGKHRASTLVPPQKVADWVDAIFAGTAASFTVFTFPIVICRWTYLPPEWYHWAEVTYAILSLVSKAYLGLYMMAAVYGVGSFANAMSDA